MTTRCERRGQLEIGIIDHEGHAFAAFGSSTQGHNVTGYTRLRNGQVSLTRWDGSTMLGCRSQVIRQFWDGSLAIVFRITNGRFIVGYALGDDGMLFRGELLTDVTRIVLAMKLSNSPSIGLASMPEDEADPGTVSPTRLTARSGNGSQVGRCDDRPA